MVFGFFMMFFIQKIIEYENYMCSEQKEKDDWKRS
jgi:hypothetical protein